MKKVLALVVAFGFGFALMGCEAPESPAEDVAPVAEKVIPAAEVVDVDLPTKDVEAEVPAAPEDTTEVSEEIVETPAK